MARLSIVIAVFLCSIATGRASLLPPTDLHKLEKALSRDSAGDHSQAAEKDAFGAGQPTEFTITNQTDITLDGCACQYKDVPKNVTIQHLEVATDRKTVLKIDFRTAK